MCSAAPRPLRALLCACAACVALLLLGAHWLAEDGARPGGDDLAAEAGVLLQPAPCAPGTDALVAVVSHAAHADARDAQRRAWPDAELAAPGLSARRVFVLARATAHAPHEEQRRHGDLLQGDWPEQYKLLLRKHLLALRWFVRHCAHARLLLKMDDDIAVDVPWLLQQAQAHLRGKEGASLLLGHMISGAAPQRSPGDKWRLSRAEYPADTFPPFLSGWAYVASASAARKLVLAAAAARAPPLWIDDVYVTGVLARAAGVARSALARPFASDVALLRCCLRAPALRCDFAAAPHGGDAALLPAAAAHARRCARAGAQRCPARAPHRALNRSCVRALPPRDARARAGPAAAAVRPVPLR